MKNYSIIKKVGSIALLFTVSNVEGLRTEARAEIDSQIEALSTSLHRAMLEEGSENMSQEAIRESLQSHLDSLMQQPELEMYPSEEQFVQLLESKKHHKRHAKHAHAKKPVQRNFVRGQADLGIKTEMFIVPIDEVDAMPIECKTNYPRDYIESVTLKAFRKVIGYDTFNSILKK